MALVESKDSLIGMQMPAFELDDIHGAPHKSSDFDNSDVLVVLFICGHCPYVHAVEERLIELPKLFENESVQFVGICSNDPTDYPEDSPEALRQRAERHGYTFPYLIDDTQRVAKAFDAVCTPDIYVFDKARKLAYHGRIDDNWKAPEQVTKHELRDAVNAILQGEAPAEPQYPTMGCSIKWKS